LKIRFTEDDANRAFRVSENGQYALIPWNMTAKDFVRELCASMPDVFEMEEEE
jgi:hypothetical protein